MRTALILMALAFAFTAGIGLALVNWHSPQLTYGESAAMVLLLAACLLAYFASEDGL